MKELSTGIEIDAPAAVVWDILMDFERYAEWNPFIKRIQGESHEGAGLEVDLLQTEGGKPMRMRPTVITCESGREFAWLGRLVIPKIFDGEHHFTIDPLGDDRVRFRQWERFAGVLLPFVGGMLENKTRPAFERMNRALKERAESAVR